MRFAFVNAVVDDHLPESFRTNAPVVAKSVAAMIALSRISVPVSELVQKPEPTMDESAEGGADYKDLNLLKQYIGENAKLVPGRMTGAKGQSRSTEVYDLLTIDEAGRYFGRDDPSLRQLVIWAGRKTPFLVLQRAYYDKHGLFAGLFDPPPQ